MEQTDVHPEILKENPPEALYDVFSTVTNTLASYGWYILGLIVLGLYAWHNWLLPKYENWKRIRDDQEYAAKYHKNPDVVVDLQTRMEAARRRMQEENDAKAALFAEKQQEREDERRREKEAERERLGYDGGQRLGNSTNKSLKPEYNPLMGGSSGSYRAPKKGCPGGGCGKK